VRFARLPALGIAAALVAGVGCDLILGIDDGIPRDDAAPDAAEPLDAGAGDAADEAAVDADAAIAFCDTDAAFGAPVAFSTLNTTAQDAHLRLTAGTELVGYFQSARDGGAGGVDIYSASRPSIGDTWTNVTDVAAVNGAGGDNDPSISADQLTLYFSRSSDLYRATRASTSAAFGAPVALAAINSAESDFAPYLTDDGAALYFSSGRASDAGVAELYATQPLADGGFAAPTAVAGTGLTTGDNRFAAVTNDQLVMYFASNRAGGQGGFDVWMTTRASTSVPFDAPRVVPEVSSTSDENVDWISSDRCRLYFSSSRSGNYDLYVATKTPP